MATRPPLPLRASTKIGLSVGALGVVFGDIGTSPLYTMKECLAHLPDVPRTEGVLGILSLIFWSLILVVSVKYLFFVTKADNQGEGGIFALLALIHMKRENQHRTRLGFAVIMILIGAALLYGDGVITPAITVLSAAEGFININPGYKPYVVAIACAILAVLFWVQHKGTKRIGGVFGPVMVVWFFVLGVLGTWQIMKYPTVLHG
ncbi:MAG: potassium transporter, partial [Verrucomicrobia bacterium]|nr:potassium transporter [Verrucomicrobiota bacterium]